MDKEIEAALAEVSDERYESLIKAFTDKIGEATSILIEIYALDKAQAVGAIPPASLPMLAWPLEDLLRDDLNAGPIPERGLATRLVNAFYNHLNRAPRVVELIGYHRHPKYPMSIRDRNGESVSLPNVGTAALDYLEKKLAQHGLRFGMLPQCQGHHPRW